MTAQAARRAREPQERNQQDQQNGSLTLPASVLSTVEHVDGVQRARGVVFVNGVQVVGSDGKLLGQPGVPAFGSSWSDDRDLSPYRLVDGHGPTGAGEVALDTQTADKGGLSVGSTRPSNDGLRPGNR